jgi:hypothetical protein
MVIPRTIANDPDSFFGDDPSFLNAGVQSLYAMTKTRD